MLWRIGAASAAIASIVPRRRIAAPDSDAAWTLVFFPSMVALVLGLAVSGIGIARAGALPPVAGVLITISALVLFGANDQDARVLLCIPLGLAAIATGVLAPRDTTRKHPGAARLAQVT